MNGVQFGRVSPDLKAKKVIVVGSGTSLSGFDFMRLNRSDYYVIAVNGAVTSVPFAKAWFTLDPWGLHGPQLPDHRFKGKLFAAVPLDYGRRDAKNVKHRVTVTRPITFLNRLISHNFADQSSETAFVLGLSDDPRCVATGNSGYGAFNVAYHLKPEKILLLGLDGGMGYFYTQTETNRALTHLPKMFNSTRHQIAKAGIQVINGSPHSTITAFPKYTIDTALEVFDAD